MIVQEAGKEVVAVAPSRLSQAKRVKSVSMAEAMAAQCRWQTNMGEKGILA